MFIIKIKIVLITTVTQDYYYYLLKLVLILQYCGKYVIICLILIIIT